MKASTTLTSLTAIVALVAAGTLATAPAFAQTTRADVTAEYLRAKNAGELEFYRDYLPANQRFAQPAGNGLSRADVKAELQRSIASGEHAAQQRDSYNGGVVAGTASTKTRDEVRAEVQRAQASGELRLMQLDSYGNFPARSAQTARPAAIEVSSAR